MTPTEIRRPLPLTLPLRESNPLPAMRGEGWGERPTTGSTTPSTAG